MEIKVEIILFEKKSPTYKKNMLTLHFEIIVLKAFTHE